MSKEREIRTCDVCGRDAECSRISFVHTGRDKARVLYNAGNQVIIPQEITAANCCDECGEKSGGNPKKVWLFLFISMILLAFGMIFCVNEGGKPGSQAGLMPLAILLFMAAWIMFLVCGCILTVRMGYDTGEGNKIGLIFLVIFLPPVAVIVLLCNAGKINRYSRAAAALKPVVISRRKAALDEKETISRLAEEGGELTEEQKKQVDEFKKKEEADRIQAEYAQQEMAEKQNRSSILSGVLGLAFTTLIAIWGFSTYSSGRGYMEWFGIRLSSGLFTGLIAVFYVLDIISIVSAVKKKNR